MARRRTVVTLLGYVAAAGALFWPALGLAIASFCDHFDVSQGVMAGLVPGLFITAPFVFAIVGIKLFAYARRFYRQPMKRKAVRPVSRKFVWMSMADILGTAHPLEELASEMKNATNGNPEAYTAADFEAFLMRRLLWQPLRRSLLRPAYYRIRDALCDALRVHKMQVRPSARLRILFPVKGRRERWDCFQQRLGVATPKLVDSPPWAWIASMILFPAFFILGAGFGFLGRVAEAGFDPLSAGIIVFLVAAIAAFSAALFRNPLIREVMGVQERGLPQDIATVGELVRHMSYHGLQTSTRWDEQSTKERANEILKSASGSPDISPNARLIADLHFPLDY